MSLKKNKKQKKKSKPKLSKNQADFRACLAYLTGITFEWSLRDPLGYEQDTFEADTSHKNAVAGLKMDRIKPHLRQVIGELKLLYRITVRVFFSSPNETYYREGALSYTDVLNAAKPNLDELIESIFNDSNMLQYTHTEFKCEILGRGSAKKAADEAMA